MLNFISSTIYHRCQQVVDAHRGPVSGVFRPVPGSHELGHQHEKPAGRIRTDSADRQRHVRRRLQGQNATVVVMRR